MKNKTLLLFLSSFLLFSFACQKGQNSDLYSLRETKRMFGQKLPIDWKLEKDAKFLYSVAIYGGGQVGVGYKLASTKHSNLTSITDCSSEDLLAAKNNLINLIISEEGKKEEEVIIKESIRLCSFIFKITSLSTMEKLVKSKEIRYIEPLGSSIAMPD